MSEKCSYSKVLLGMSGGVDSSVAIRLLQEGGYEVTGLIILTGYVPKDSVDKAKAAAAELNIELIIMDSADRFELEVINPLVDGYKQGLTPNPCILCNPAFKFKLLESVADDKNIGHIATGHYAKLTDIDGDKCISRAANRANDQSYFLYRLPKRIRDRLIFPLGDMSKAEVRQKAAQIGLGFEKVRSSQEACFTQCGLRNWLKRIQPGLFWQGPAYDVETGKLVGHHEGSAGLTIGQRRGHGIAAGRRAYIVKIDATENSIYLGEMAHCMTDIVRTKDLVHSCPKLPRLERGGRKMHVKVRSSMDPVEAEVRIFEDGISAELAEPILAPAPGQSLVCYDQDVIMMGGIIT